MKLDCRACQTKEFIELSERVEGMARSLRSASFYALSDDDRYLAVEQYRAMVHYRVTLRERLERLGVSTVQLKTEVSHGSTDCKSGH